MEQKESPSPKLRGFQVLHGKGSPGCKRVFRTGHGALAHREADT